MRKKMPWPNTTGSYNNEFMLVILSFLFPKIYLGFCFTKEIKKNSYILNPDILKVDFFALSNL